MTLFRVLLLVWLLLLPTARSQSNDEEKGESSVPPDYLIIGSGASGLQMALLLSKYGHSYTILEKHPNKVGSFWLQFPRFRELISVNKWVRNETQRLRFDWHSLLEAPLVMQDVTEDYFPQADDYQIYLERVAQEANINIEFGMEVQSLDTDEPCVYLKDGTKRCAQHRVFVGTGLREKPETHLQALGGIPYSNMTKEKAYHRRVCILGNGNSGFEVAQNVVGSADRVVLYGRHPHRFSAVTRYTGDVRLKFAQALENFHGKLLDTVDHFTIRPILPTATKNLPPHQVKDMSDMIEAASFVAQYKCEALVLATGFKSYVPGLDSKSMFPPTSDWYAWNKNDKIHFIGWLMHEMDFRKGAGGFASGFRYLIRNLVHHIRFKDFGVQYPYLTLTKEQVIDHALARVQTADDLVILQDAQTVKDVVVKTPTRTEDGETLYHYYEGITFKFHKDVKAQEEAMSLYFAWGDSRKSSRVFENVVRYNDTNHLINVFLHPVVQVGGLVRHILEDTDMEWTKPLYESATVKTIRAAMEDDLSEFMPRKWFPYQRDAVNEDGRPREYETAGTDPSFDIDLLRAIALAAQRNGRPEDFDDLRSLAKETMPDLFEAVQM